MQKITINQLVHIMFCKRRRRRSLYRSVNKQRQIEPEVQMNI